MSPSPTLTQAAAQGGGRHRLKLHGLWPLPSQDTSFSLAAGGAAPSFTSAPTVMSSAPPLPPGAFPGAASQLSTSVTISVAEAAGAADPRDLLTTRSLYYGPTLARRRQGGEVLDLLSLQEVLMQVSCICWLHWSISLLQLSIIC